MNSLTCEERAKLLSTAEQMNARLYPAKGVSRPPVKEAVKLRETYYQVLGEYADRLPRITVSACPFTSLRMKHSFDPWGLDGPWWHCTPEVKIEEPTFPPTFKVILGAINFHGRVPEEAKQSVLPGPEVPFVVPRLLNLPGMIAVVSCLKMETGDVAYAIVYFSEADLPHRSLHQFWLRQDYWFEVNGKSSWLIANDLWDFNLQPWINSGKLRWIQPNDPKSKILDGRNGELCPFVDLAGDRFPQTISFGKRKLLNLPDGRLINPYDD
jgi:hypothetical protein